MRRIKQTIGWREWVSLPELGIRKIKPKIDTGARSSSLHTFDLELFKRGGVSWVRFQVHPLQRNSRKTVSTEAKVIEVRQVRASSGHVSTRPVISTDIELLGERWPIEITLADRFDMSFRMLLGREAIRGRFVVDPGKSYYGGKPRKPRKATS